MQVNLERIVSSIQRFTAQQVVPLKRRLRELDAERAELTKAIEMLNGGSANAAPSMRVATSPGPKAATMAPRKKKRIRRSLAQVQAEARRILDFVKSGKSEGVSGSEVRRRFPGVKGTIL